ncbi:sensor histidine kinase [Roseateles cellulosilyticus]|uniref:Histidine kinase n=1 Tax=Pelomonas cellulosilytica TaxID=2906762 RepID=A0ABS8XNL2_9BURK|nr:sensor histidine kinase [Pelomonas sp. P8]MCE4554364.1 histidine kinase [Pelomonas sp. P8]
MRLPCPITACWRLLKRAAVAGALAVAAGQAPAEPEFPPLQGHFHRAWLSRLGAPAEVVEVVQTPDGFLWLSTDQGLMRFDGQRFARLDLFPDDPRRSQAMALMRVMPDGTLWAALRLGGMVRVRGTQVEFFGPEQGFPLTRPYAGAVDDDGVVWMATPLGLMRFLNERWQRVDREVGLPPKIVDNLYRTAGGDLWLRMQDDWYLRRKGDQAFAPQPRWEGMQEVIEEPGQGFWVMRPRGPLELVDERGKVLQRLPLSLGESVTLIRDGQGDLWVVDYGKGLYRVPAAPAGPSAVGARPQIQHLSARDGLSSDQVMSVLKDRDGQIWAGTQLGLDRVSRDRVTLVPHPEGNSAGTVRFDAQGRACMVNYADPVACQDREGTFQVLRGGQPAAPVRAVVLAPDAQGGMWIAGLGGVWFRDAAGGLTAMPRPDGVSVDIVQSLAVAPDGSAWLATLGEPVRRWVDGRWLPEDASLPTEGALTLAADPARGMWLGTADGQVLHWRDGKVQRFGTAEGLPPGRVLALLPAGDALWIGGEQGLLRLKDGHVERVSRSDGVEFGRITGLAETAQGDLWMNETRGALRLAALDRAALARSAGAPVSVLQVGPEDGLVGSLPPIRPANSMVRAPDGQIWLSRASGIYRFDPGRFGGTERAPPIAVLDTLGDPASGHVQDGRVTLRFTAADLFAPNRLRFRYRLLGQDHDWVEAGERREARYTNLAPGHYRFEVQADNCGGGAWPEDAKTASAEIDVPAAWHQLGSVRLAAAAAVLVLVWLTWRAWSARATRRLQERLQARLAERERIARHLHDHLLQGAAGLTLQVQAGLQDLPDEHPARRQLERALDRADRLLNETREQVEGLRIHQHDCDLGEVLMNQARALRGEAAEPALRLDVLGTPRRLRAALLGEVQGIVIEAVNNALHHAAARDILLQLDYRPRGLVLSVKDDGRGLPDGFRPEIGRPGHWGLRGMQERAGLLGAQLHWTSAPGQGTTVTLSLPAGTFDGGTDS